MFLKKKNIVRFDQLTHHQKVKHLQKITKIPLANLKTSIIQSDLEEDDINFPLCMNQVQIKLPKTHYKKQSNQKQVYKQKRIQSASLQQKLNKSIKNITKQLYCEQLINKIGVLSPFKAETLNFNKLNKSKYHQNNLLNKNCIVQSNVQSNETMFQKSVSKSNLLNITFIPSSKILKRGSEPLQQLSTRSNIFTEAKKYQQMNYTSNLNIQPYDLQKEKSNGKNHQKKSKFNRSNRKSFNQVNKENNTDKKIYSITKEHNNLSGWVTKRQKIQFFEVITQRSALNEININTNLNKQILKKCNNLHYEYPVNKQTQNADNIQEKIQRHRLYDNLQECQNLQELKKFSKLLLMWYKQSNQKQY